MDPLKISIWNANGLCQHEQEVKYFLHIHNIDILLVSETHFTSKSYFKIKNYELYQTNHPDGKAHGGTAVIIKSKIKHSEKPKCSLDYLQSTNVEVVLEQGNYIISSVYCPPRHSNNRDRYANFFSTLGNRFICGGDFNAKHAQWGSRLITYKGKELLAAIQNKNLQHISTGTPSYWPSDPAKIPDLLDFFIFKGVDNKKMKIESHLDLSSDHSPITLIIFETVQKKESPLTLTNRKTNWNQFRDHLDSRIDLNIPLKSQVDIEVAVNSITNDIQQAAWFATPELNIKEKKYNATALVTELIAEKRRTKRRWQQSTSISQKRETRSQLNRIIKRLKYELKKEKNESIQSYLSKLSATKATDYSLWKATKKIKQPQRPCPPIRQANGNWARNNVEKGKTFADHLKDVFNPWPIPTNKEDSDEIDNLLASPFQMDFPITKFSRSDVAKIIKREINPKKSPGYDLITGKILHEITTKCLAQLTQIFNAVLRLNYFPCQWKVSQIIMILKPGKQPENVSSYRPISILPTLSKVMEKLIQERLKPIIEQRNIIPNHQFGFRNKHSTIEQVHRIVNIIDEDFEKKHYCCAVFLDISQAFDKVWHKGLIYKIRKQLPYQYYELLKSYLENRFFMIKQFDQLTNLEEINSGVPQGSILGPLLYLLYTADIPHTDDTTIATFADDTAILGSNKDKNLAAIQVQRNLNQISVWLNKWKIRANETKSAHVTFALRQGSCPPVYLNGTVIPQATDVKYLGIHLDRRLTWRKHIFTKRIQLNLKLRQMYWLIGRKSEMTLENKVLLYKAILKPIWTYGIQLWGTAKKSNIEIIQRFQNKLLRSLVNAPWFVPNTIIQNDLNISSIQEVIQEESQNYRKRITMHPNILCNPLMTINNPRRLRRTTPSNL